MQKEKQSGNKSDSKMAVKKVVNLVFVMVLLLENCEVGLKESETVEKLVELKEYLSVAKSEIRTVDN
jgi:hypothetical protein